MKKLFGTGLLLFFFSINLIGQEAVEPPKAVLDNGDIEKYAETIYPMAVELEKLGMKMDGKEDNVAANWAANVEGQAILSKYGWNETFAIKFAAITWGFTYLKMKVEVDKLPDDQKAQVQAMMPLFSTYESLVHPDDVKLVESNMEILEPAFKKLEKL
ncbi:MAG: hypothetical protein RIC15_06175 [Vicingaceae bacterium]